jgi:hypothetical protein
MSCTTHKAHGPRSFLLSFFPHRDTDLPTAPQSTHPLSPYSDDMYPLYGYVLPHLIVIERLETRHISS